MENNYLKIENQQEDKIVMNLLGNIGYDIRGIEIIEKLNVYKKRKILLNIFSPGGGFYDAMAVYDYVKANGIDIEMAIHGLAGSAATIIACAGTKVLMGKNSYYFIHHVINASKASKPKFTQTIINIYKEKSGLSESEIIKLMDDGDKKRAFLTAQEALDKGFVDEIINENDLKPENWVETIINGLYLNDGIPVNGIAENNNEEKKMNEEMKTLLESFTTRFDTIEKALANEDISKEEKTTLMKENTELKTQFDTLKTKLEAFETEKENKLNSDIENFVGKLITEKKIKPSEKEKIVAHAKSLCKEGVFNVDNFKDDMLFSMISNLKPGEEDGENLTAGTETDKTTNFGAELGIEKESYANFDNTSQLKF